MIDNGGHSDIIDTLCTVRQMCGLKIIICVNNVFDVVLNVSIKKYNRTILTVTFVTTPGTFNSKYS